MKYFFDNLKQIKPLSVLYVAVAFSLLYFSANYQIFPPESKNRKIASEPSRNYKMEISQRYSLKIHLTAVNPLNEKTIIQKEARRFAITRDAEGIPKIYFYANFETKSGASPIEAFYGAFLHSDTTNGISDTQFCRPEKLAFFSKINEMGELSSRIFYCDSNYFQTKTNDLVEVINNKASEALLAIVLLEEGISPPSEVFSKTNFLVPEEKTKIENFLFGVGSDFKVALPFSMRVSSDEVAANLVGLIEISHRSYPDYIQWKKINDVRNGNLNGFCGSKSLSVSDHKWCGYLRQFEHKGLKGKIGQNFISPLSEKNKMVEFSVQDLVGDRGIWGSSLLMKLAGGDCAFYERTSEKETDWSARRQRKLQLMKNLVAAGENPNSRDVLGMSPLFFAVAHGCVDEARQLLNLGADVNIENSFGVGLLSLALANGQPELISLILEKYSQEKLLSYFVDDFDRPFYFGFECKAQKAEYLKLDQFNTKTPWRVAIDRGNCFALKEMLKLTDKKPAEELAELIGKFFIYNNSYDVELLNLAYKDGFINTELQKLKNNPQQLKLYLNGLDAQKDPRALAYKKEILRLLAANQKI